MNQSLKNRFLKRLKISEGQVRGLEIMLENDIYCMDVIVQSTAVINALSSFEGAVLKNHLSTHIIEQLKAGQHSQAVAEIMKVYRLSTR